jgi:hypothetical protein
MYGCVAYAGMTALVSEVRLTSSDIDHQTRTSWLAICLHFGSMYYSSDFLLVCAY